MFRVIREHFLGRGDGRAEVGVVSREVGVVSRKWALVSREVGVVSREVEEKEWGKGDVVTRRVSSTVAAGK